MPQWIYAKLKSRRKDAVDISAFEGKLAESEVAITAETSACLTFRTKILNDNELPGLATMAVYLILRYKSITGKNQDRLSLFLSCLYSGKAPIPSTIGCVV